MGATKRLGNNNNPSPTAIHWFYSCQLYRQDPVGHAGKGLMLYVGERSSVTAQKYHRKREELQNPCELKLQILSDKKEVLTSDYIIIMSDR